MPKISVVIPVYNQCSFIMKAIQSVRNQTFRDYEIIVIDDGSTDAIQKQFQSNHGDIHYLYKKNGGTASALNKGIRLAMGSWICWLSADDLFMPGKLAKQLELAESRSNAGMIYTSFCDIDENGTITTERYSPSFPNKSEWAKALLKHCYINGSSVMVRKDLLYQIGLFDETLPYAHDYDLWLRLLPECEFVHCPELLLHYRKHAGSTTERMNMEVHKAELATIKLRATELYRKKGLIQ